MNQHRPRIIHKPSLGRQAALPRSLVAFLVAYLLSLTLAELLVFYLNPALGLVLHALLFITFIAQGVLTDGDTHELYIALAILPLIRLLSITMPFWLVDQAGFFALVNLPLIVATVVVARYLGYKRGQLGLTLGRLPWQLLIATSGLLFGYLERLIIQPPAITPDLSLAAVWWPALSLLLFTGLSEELLFRGVLQTAAVKSLGAWWGILYISLLFGVMHIGWQSALDVIFVTVVGLFFGWVVHRTGSILGVTLAHGLTNIVLFIVLPHLGR